MELSQDLLNNWDEHYPLSKFKLCKEFQGLKINPDAIRQIKKSQFNQVPLILAQSRGRRDVVVRWGVARSVGAKRRYEVPQWVHL